MSFPRARLVRFNEETGCAPAPGTYMPKNINKPILGIFDRSERFVEPKSVATRPGCSSPLRATRRHSFQGASPDKRDSPSFRRSISVSDCFTQTEALEEYRTKNEVDLCEACCSKSINDNAKAEATTSNLPACENCEVQRESSLKQTKSLRRVNQALEKKIEGVESEAAKQLAFCEAIKIVSKSLPDFEKEVMHLKEVNVDLNNKITALQCEIIDYKLQICTINDNFDELKALQNQMEMEKALLKVNISQRNNLIVVCQVKVDMVKDELAKEVRKNSKLKVDMDDVRRELCLSKDMIMELKAKLSCAVKENEAKEEENRRLDVQMNKIIADRDKKYKSAREEHVRITDLLCYIQDDCDTKQKTLGILQLEVDMLKRSNEELQEGNLKLIIGTTENIKSLLRVVDESFNSLISEKSETNLSVKSSQVIIPGPSDLINKTMVDLKIVVQKLSTYTAECKQQRDALEKELQLRNTENKNLEELIGPFREQLVNYEHERQILTMKTLKSQGELQAIALQQAASLGHQNQKQKIKYLVQLKESNLKLKDEVDDLRAKLRQKDRVIAKMSKECNAEEVHACKGLSFSNKENSSDKK